jgi:CheY-like chemotaxis protein
LQEEAHAKTAFFHNTSHELRTPLNGILGFVELLVSSHFGGLTPKINEKITQIGRLATSLKNQVDTILDLAKSKRGEMALNNSSVPLNELIEDTSVLAEGLVMKGSGRSFQVEKTWELAQSPCFIGDREKIYTVIRNLIGNALKFTDSKRLNNVKLRMEVTSSSSRKLLSITVSDSGIGIPEKFKDSIFEEFKQVDHESRRAFEGTGLGLTMVRDLVKLMDGTINVESQLGVGSKFTVTVPEQATVRAALPPRAVTLEQNMTFPSEDKTEIFAAVSPDSEVAKTEKPYRILVVDDNEINCEVVSEILKSDGFPVEIALGGRAALEKLETDCPDLMILDLMMPEISGEDVMKIIKTKESLRSLPVILLTARASQDDRLMGLSMGADDYLAKPVIGEEIKLRVANILSRLDLAKEQSEKRVLIDNLKSAQNVFESLGKNQRKAPEFEFASLYKPAENIGGDWYCVHLDREGKRLYAVIGDVTGHGINSALITVAAAGAVKASLEIIEQLGRKISMEDGIRILAQATNQAVLEASQQSNKAMTMAFVSFELETGAGWFTLAGHPAIHVASPMGEARELFCTGPMLGIEQGAEFELKPFQLNVGERLFLYTDGLIENADSNQQPAVHRKIGKILQAQDGTPDFLKAQIMQHAELSWSPGVAHDDCAFIIICWLGNQQPRVRALPA